MDSRAGGKKILVVDDDEGVRRFVGAMLRGQDYAVFAVENGQDALTEAVRVEPDFVILDLTLPELGGLEVCARLREWYTGPILVLSGSGDVKTIVQALDEGADDYITKPFRPAELLARMRALFRRSDQSADPLESLDLGQLSIDFAKRRVSRSGKPIRLTKTEFEILACLARQHDRVVSAETILRTVWGPHHGEYAQSLRVHVGHIRKKIEPLPSSPRFIVTEPGVGYRFSTEDVGGPQVVRTSA